MRLTEQVSKIYPIYPIGMFVSHLTLLPWFQLMTIVAVEPESETEVLVLGPTKRALKIIVASGTLCKLYSVLRMLIRAIVSTYEDTRNRSEQLRAPPENGTALRNGQCSI